MLKQNILEAVIESTDLVCVCVCELPTTLLQAAKTLAF